MYLGISYLLTKRYMIANQLGRAATQEWLMEVRHILYCL